MATGITGKQMDKNFLRKEFYQNFDAPTGQTTTLFTLSAVPIAAACVKVFVGTVSSGSGLLVRQGVEYSVVNQAIVWLPTARFSLTSNHSVSVTYVGKD